MTVQSLSLVSPLDFATLSTSLPTPLTGFINIHLSAPLSVRLVLHFRGTYFCQWSNHTQSLNNGVVPSGIDTGTVVKKELVVWDGHMEKGYRRLEWIMDMDGVECGGFVWDAGRGSDSSSDVPLSADDRRPVFRLSYTMKCVAAYTGGTVLGTRKEKSVEAEVIIIDPSALRAKMLGNLRPAVFLPISAPGEGRNERWDTPQRMVRKRQDVDFNFVVPRRNVLPGDVLPCVLSILPPDGLTVTSVTVTLMERVLVLSKTYGLVSLTPANSVQALRPSSTPTRVLSAVRELNWKQFGKEWVVRNLPISVPWDSAPTVETGFFRSAVILRLSVLCQSITDSSGDTEEEILTFDIPIRIVAPDLKAGKIFVPSLQRSHSLKYRKHARSPVSPSTPSPPQSPRQRAQIMETYRAIYPYTPHQPDEISLIPGDIVQIHKAYRDGFVHASVVPTDPVSPSMPAPPTKASTPVSGPQRAPNRKEGIIPLHHLLPHSSPPIISSLIPPTSSPHRVAQPLDVTHLCRHEPRSLLLRYISGSANPMLSIPDGMGKGILTAPKNALLSVVVRTRQLGTTGRMLGCCPKCMSGW
ncbi:hypothetical protein BC832DRAFT_614347 [Gaertneriomyces semiglobifer]|nr:hypothetical protein BC832DRAFT_614347 [Gaertneriomyces semiglobifer]